MSASTKIGTTPVTGNDVTYLITLANVGNSGRACQYSYGAARHTFFLAVRYSHRRGWTIPRAWCSPSVVTWAMPTLGDQGLTSNILTIRYYLIPEYSPLVANYSLVSREAPSLLGGCFQIYGAYLQCLLAPFHVVYQ